MAANDRKIVIHEFSNPAFVFRCCLPGLLPAAHGSLMVLLDEFGDQSGPTGLVARADPGAVVAVEVFVERDQIVPVRVVLEFFRAAEYGSSLIRTVQEDAHQPV